MEKIYLVVIKTEDTETYYYSYKSKPTLKQIKNDFFGDHGDTYPKSEWKMTIYPEIIELSVK
jgi:hypothetical protein